MILDNYLDFDTNIIPNNEYLIFYNLNKEFIDRTSDIMVKKECYPLGMVGVDDYENDILSNETFGNDSFKDNSRLIAFLSKLNFKNYAVNIADDYKNFYDFIKVGNNDIIKFQFNENENDKNKKVKIKTLLFSKILCKSNFIYLSSYIMKFDIINDHKSCLTNESFDKLKVNIPEEYFLNKLVNSSITIFLKIISHIFANNMIKLEYLPWLRNYIFENDKILKASYNEYYNNDLEYKNDEQYLKELLRRTHSTDNPIINLAILHDAKIYNLYIGKYIPKNYDIFTNEKSLSQNVRMRKRVINFVITSLYILKCIEFFSDTYKNIFQYDSYFQKDINLDEIYLQLYCNIAKIFNGYYSSESIIKILEKINNINSTISLSKAIYNTRIKSYTLCNKYSYKVQKSIYGLRERFFYFLLSSIIHDAYLNSCDMYDTQIFKYSYKIFKKNIYICDIKLIRYIIKRISIIYQRMYGQVGNLYDLYSKHDKDLQVLKTYMQHKQYQSLGTLAFKFRQVIDSIAKIIYNDIQNSKYDNSIEKDQIIFSAISYWLDKNYERTPVLAQDTNKISGIETHEVSDLTAPEPDAQEDDNKKKKISETDYRNIAKLLHEAVINLLKKNDRF